MLDRILDLVPADRIGYVHVAGGVGAPRRSRALPRHAHRPRARRGARPARPPASSARPGCRCCWSATAATHPPPCSPPSSPPSRKHPAHDPRTPDGESPFPGRRVSVFDTPCRDSGDARRAAGRARRRARRGRAGPAGLRPRPPRRRPARAAAQAGGRSGEALAGARRVARATLVDGVRRARTRAASRAEHFATAGTSPAPCAPSCTADAARELRDREARWRYDGVRPPRPRRLRAALRTLTARR